MERFYYAQVLNGVVVGVQESPRAIEHSALIAIDDADPSIIGKRYENGEFVANE